MSKRQTLGLTNLVTWNNIKLGGQIPQLNMPYVLSCRQDAPCFKECYCRHGNMAFLNVRNRHRSLMDLYLENSKDFFNEVDRELAWNKPKYFRYHSSGDIVDEQYLNLMCWLARRHKTTRFLCFTKKYEMINAYLDKHRKPSNLIIVLSNWGSWRVDNPHNLPESFVDFGNNSDQIPIFAYECTGHCDSCEGQHCWHMKNGDSVCFHKH